MTTCDREWSDWSRSRLFLPLVHQMLGYLAGLTDGGPVRNALLDSTESVTDEAPGVYKDLELVMGAQQDLVQRLARFEPKIVKMAPAGERPED